MFIRHGATGQPPPQLKGKICPSLGLSGNMLSSSMQVLPAPLYFLKNCSLTKTNSFRSRQIFIGDIDIQDNPCRSGHIRSTLNYTTAPAARFFWPPIMSDLQWKKACSVLNKYCIGNKVKEVSYKVLHQIYPAEEVLERFKLKIDYSCTFCNVDKEYSNIPIFHLFYHCNHSVQIWNDMQDFVN